MSSRQCDRVLSAIARQPWAITPDGLELVLGIAERSISDKQAVLAAPTERRESGKVQMRDGVAVISVMGPIFPRADFFTDISGATSIETLALRFGEAVAADDVKAIVLHVDSPGGQIVGVHEFANQIYAAREKKPVVAYAAGMNTSAAYWISSAASKIVAEETALLGSIGVVAAWTDDKEARKSAGLKDYEVVSSQSPNKRLDPESKEGRAALQRILDETADIFIADVARYRGKRAGTVTEQFGQGGVMLAAEAVKVGMADEIGSLEDVIAALSNADGVSGSGSDDRIAVNNKETCMDKVELAKKHPELLAAIRAEARAQAETELAETHQKQLEAVALNMVALMSAVAGKETAEKVGKLAAAGFTAGQIEAIAPLLAAPAASEEQEQGEKDAGPDGRAEILAALRKASAGPVNTTVAPRGGDAVQAAIDQISAVSV
jgi:signal peptide peptidase SppA